MTGATIGWIVIGLIVLAAIVVGVVYLMTWLYRRSTKETAFVRTGWGGETVVKDGGAFVLPIVHEVIPVNMNTLRLEIRRARDAALITKNRMRVDVVAEFYVRVQQSPEAIAAAAQTLGRRTMQPDTLKELVEGKFVDALRSVAAETTMEEMHEKRGDYVKRVRQAASEDLLKNGLELEAVSLTGMDQTNMEFFNPSNAFDAEGLTRLTEEIERRKKIRNDIEQDTIIEIRNKNLEAEKMALQIDRDSEYARLEQQRDIEARRVGQQAELARERAEREREAEQAQIQARLDIDRARLVQEQTLDEIRIARERDTQRLEIERRRALEESELTAQRETEEYRIGIDRALEQARIARAIELERLDVERRQALELAERDREIALFAKAREQADADAKAQAARVAAEQEVETARIGRDRAVETARITREKEVQALEVSRRQALEEAEIAAREDVERLRIATERALDEARITQDRDTRRLEIDRRLALEIAEMERLIAVSAKTKEQSEALVEAETARAKAITAEERVFSARQTEIAERKRALELIDARREAERQGLMARMAAEAEKDAAMSRAEAERLVAEGAAEAEKLRALASKLRYEIDAEGRRQMNEALNVLTDESRGSEMRLKLIDKLDAIIRESVKPMERIEGIKILQVEGLTGAGGAGGGHGGGSGGGTGGGGGRDASLAESVVDSALRYRAQAPLIDSLLKEVGLSGGDVREVGALLQGATPGKPGEDADRKAGGPGGSGGKDRDAAE